MSNLSFTPQTRQCFSKPANGALTPLFILRLCLETRPRHNEVGCVSSADWPRADDRSRHCLSSFMPLVSDVERLLAQTLEPPYKLHRSHLKAVSQHKGGAAEAAEVLRSHPLPLQRPAESVVAAAGGGRGGRSHCLPCRCAASDMF